MAKLTKEVDRWFCYGQLSHVLGSNADGKLLSELKLMKFYNDLKDLADKLYGVNFPATTRYGQMVCVLNRFLVDTGLPYEIKDLSCLGTEDGVALESTHGKDWQYLGLNYFLKEEDNHE